MNDLFRNIRSIIENEIRRGTERFVIYPFSDLGHMVKEILEWDYGKNPIVVDSLLSQYNKNIISVDDLQAKDLQSSVILLSVGNPNGTPYFRELVKDIDVPCLDVRESLNTFFYPSKESYFKEVKRLLQVMSVVGGHEFIRIGRMHDGGYIMLNDFADITKVYSFGISNDVSWEKDMASRGIFCHMYDHTIDKLPEDNHLFSWKKRGIAGQDVPAKSLYSLETLMRENGDIENKNLILKMDVEGAEWKCLTNTSSTILDNFVQMVFEFHDVTNPSNEYVLPVFNKLNITHVPVWLHGNNNQPAEMAGGITFAPAMEVLYLNKRCYQFCQECESFPWVIDMPNNTNYPEVILGDFSK